MKTIQFNTGRRYTQQGQRIVATLHDDRVVTFMDHDRGIYGEFALGMHCSFNDTEVMHWYDSSTYKCGTRAMNDGMIPGGCNTTLKI
jgi:hypothetical protein